MAVIGGVNDELDVKILILYILNYAGAPLKRDNLMEIALDAGSAEYFSLSQATDELLMTGHIDITSESTPDILRITGLGRTTLDLFEKNLPYTVRRKNQAALLNMLSKIERAKNVKSDIIKKEHGYEAVCTLLDGDDILLEYRLFVPTLIQAQLITSQFEADPTVKYKSILELLIDEKLFEDN